MMMSHAQIAGLVPHQGTMCLLETVESWDSRVVLCTAASHRDPNHPLRDDSMLPAVCGIEYAGQAIAVHCGLLAGNECDRPIGLLVAVREVTLAVERLDAVPDDLMIRAEKLIGQGGSLMYHFKVEAGNRELISGRISVMILSRSRMLGEPTT
jgi:predicted hotdog family 3-hydroxylacyl-ACP dehydratase